MKRARQIARIPYKFHLWPYPYAIPEALWLEYLWLLEHEFCNLERYKEAFRQAVETYIIHKAGYRGLKRKQDLESLVQHALELAVDCGESWSYEEAQP